MSTVGITKTATGYKAIARHDTSPEMKREIMARIPEDVRVFVTECAKQFGRLNFVGVKWHE